MKVRQLTVLFVIGVLLLIALPLVAQSDLQFLGTFSDPFTTYAVNGDLAYPGELDWYSFEIVDEASTIFVLAESAGDSTSIRALVFAENEDYIDATTDGYLQTVLEPGSYRVRIDSVQSSAMGYSLTILNGIEVESNDGLIESNDLGELSTFVQLFATLLPAGDADFYSFQVPDAGLPNNNNGLWIHTDGPASGDTVLILYRFDADADRYLPVAFDDDSGEDYWSQLLVRPLPGDRLALRIEETAFPLEGIGAYGLSIVPVTLTIDDEPNNTSSQATPLVPIDEQGTAWMIDGILDGDDSIDFFTFTIEASALVQIATEAQGSAGDYDTFLALYTPDGTLLAESDDSGDGGWSRISLSLQPGDYVVTVEIGDYEMPPLPYRLTAAATSVQTVSELEPNDTDESAQSIDWIQGDALLIEAAIDVGGDVDSFRFVLAETATLTIETGPPSGLATSNDTTLALYDEELWQIASNDDANGSWSRVEQTLPAGTYYIVVESYFSDEVFDYSLLITTND